MRNCLAAFSGMFVAMVTFMFCEPLIADVTETIDLSGEWTVRLDPNDVGVEKRWFEQQLPNVIKLPGSIQSQGLGEPPSDSTPWTGMIRQDVIAMPRYAPYRKQGNYKMPFWLQPKRCYVGSVWFQRRVAIPSEWSGKHITLSLERPHWSTTVWIDGLEIGRGDSLSTPHRFDLNKHVPVGGHTITIRVDNRVKINVGENSHSVTDHTQTNWNGIVGDLTLHACDPVWIDDVQVVPDLRDQVARIRVAVVNHSGHPLDVQLQLQATSGNPPTEMSPLGLALERWAKTTSGHGSTTTRGRRRDSS